METPSSALKRILVVDDEPLVANAVKMVLTFAGYKVQTAGSGEEALATMEQGEFDLIITDFSMQGMKGDELALHIKARWPHLPVIMLTAYAENIRDSLNVVTCVDTLISKPFDVDQLRLAVARALAGGNSQAPPEPS